MLNGKGNVCLEKIRLVEAAAEQLGYTVNRQAKNLRKSVADIVAVILPGLQTPEYIELYDAIRQSAESEGCKPQLHITDGFPDKELDILKNLDLERIRGIAAVTSLRSGQTGAYAQLMDRAIPVAFAERRPRGLSCLYLGFDYAKAGSDIAREIATYPGGKTVGLFTLSTAYSCENDFIGGLTSRLGADLLHVKTDMNLAVTHAFSFFENGSCPGVIVTTHERLADELRRACRTLELDDEPVIVTLASAGLHPGRKPLRYRLNYGWLGKALCGRLLSSVTGPDDVLLPADGFIRNLNFQLLPQKKTINLLTLASPATHALMQLAPTFTKKTGIGVNFAVFSHEELYNIISHIQDYSFYDVIRLDAVWLPWFAQKALLELEFDAMGFDHIRERVIPHTLEEYSVVGGRYYALPFDLSIQMLFYRKDFWEDPKIKRMYYEHTKASLQVPQSYREFNDIAAFFTRSVNAQSPVPYGTVMPLGNSSVVTLEYLSRLHDLGGDVFGSDGCCTLDSDAASLALQYYKEAFGYAPSATGDSWWNLSAQHFAEGNAAQIIIFSNYATDIINSRTSKVLGNIGCGTVPGNRPAIGGGTLGVSKYSQHIEESLLFLRWVSNEETAAAFSYMGGVAPYESIFTDTRLLSLYPWLPVAKEGIKNGTVQRILEHSNTAIEERKLDAILGMAIKNYLLNIVDEKQALQQAKAGIDAFMASCPPAGRP